MHLVIHHPPVRVVRVNDMLSTATRSGFRGAVRARPVLTFVVLTYAITWAFWLPALGLARDAGAPNFAVLFGLQTLGVLGPLVGGAVAAWASGDLRAWFRRLVNWRVPLRWWVVAVVVPLGLLTLALASAVLLGGSFDLAALIPVAVLPVFLLQAFVRGGLEEPGWRGFAQPALQTRFGAFRAALLVGLAWFGWHVPLFFMPGSQQLGVSTVTYAVSLLALSVLLAGLYNATGSVLPAVLFHTLWNGVQVWVTTGTLGGEPALPVGLVLAGLLWAAAVLLVGWYGTDRLAPRSAPGRPRTGATPDLQRQ
jgi:membrane protease YdiL (CAAX protease family)